MEKLEALVTLGGRFHVTTLGWSCVWLPLPCHLQLPPQPLLLIFFSDLFLSGVWEVYYLCVDTFLWRWFKMIAQNRLSSGCIVWCVFLTSKYDLVSSAAAAAKSLQSCPTLCDPIDGSPPGSQVPGILQARTLEWVAVSFSNAWRWKEKVKSLSRVRLFTTPWTTAYQAPPSIGVSRQEYWNGLPLPSP